jgi:hypothetical protein
MWAGRQGTDIVIEAGRVGKAVGKECPRLPKLLMSFCSWMPDSGQYIRHRPLIDGPGSAEPLDYLHKG